MTLTGFLLARLIEDEAAVRSASPGPWKIEISDSWSVLDADGNDVCGAEAYVHENDVLHISRNDPGRVLAEVEAKRRIVALHHDEPTTSLPPFRGSGFCAQCEDRDQHDSEPYPCPTLRLLALPYADHPDYRPEWKP